MNKRLGAFLGMISTGLISFCGVSLAQDSLEPGQELGSGGTLYSNNGCFALKLQQDGNLVLFNSNQPLWSSGTEGRSVQRLWMQPDGNLVMYAYNGQPIWASQTVGRDGSRLVVQNDGNAVIYAPSSNRPVWTTQTSGRSTCRSSSNNTEPQPSYRVNNPQSDPTYDGRLTAPEMETFPPSPYFQQSTPTYSQPTPTFDARQSDPNETLVNNISTILKVIIDASKGNQ